MRKKILQGLSEPGSSGDQKPVLSEYLEVFAKQENVLLCMYSGLPEPHTHNAIMVMAEYFNSVTFLRNNLFFPVASYPHTPILKEIGSPCEVQSVAQKGPLWKLLRFGLYLRALSKELKSRKYNLVVIHDYLALLAFWLVKQRVGYRGLAWFNSYDALDLENVPIRKFSLMNIVAKNHRAIFSELDFFSLPAVERIPYYPTDRVKKAIFVIPNFPALRFYKTFYHPKDLRTKPLVKLIYQGALGRGHGFEEFIKILNKRIQGKPLQLILKGWIGDEYRQELVRLAERCSVADKLSFESFGLYHSVPQLASRCTIGLAIFTKEDLMNNTLGTASNKIYEYAALGLPVILYDTPHFRKHLDRRIWAFFTDLSECSLLSIIGEIVANYESISKAAHESFVTELNYEAVFLPALYSVVQELYQHANSS